MTRQAPQRQKAWELARWLCRPSVVTRVLNAHQIRPSPSMGQHFLVNPTFLDRIVEAADLRETDWVFEVGTGLGCLTAAAASVAQKVVSIEKDRRLYQIARAILQHIPGVELRHADALKVNWGAILNDKPPQRWIFLSNLPYSVSKAILERLLDNADLFGRAVITVQREVGFRMVASAGSPDYGLLSVMVALKSRPTVVARIPPTAFFPRPQVWSVVVRLDFEAERLIAKEEEDYFFLAAQAALSYRRKTLANALLSGLGWDPEDIQALLSSAGLNPKRRGETLTLEEIVALSRAFKERSVRSR
ncbi:MAG: 16S rRNA (adenine(1518)-N(6)/adenine(1519)-N(6))-dimethyltransferase RsmA [Armatimonadetes bacterium]|nr:16S rRNA (adenine(1518)-N(6)/adenine(1519)-N(6))-dimethyltransferase RsmA [Armatimonadota bacterium]MDW8121239.1 16S rRNA (adenine(1518)-N(6)/adenine(1519)-N(6))-dimethyltransferase RsmA [Armatimonadota bacterium]